MRPSPPRRMEKVRIVSMLKNSDQKPDTDVIEFMKKIVLDNIFTVKESSKEKKSEKKEKSEGKSKSEKKDEDKKDPG